MPSAYASRFIGFRQTNSIPWAAASPPKVSARSARRRSLTSVQTMTDGAPSTWIARWTCMRPIGPPAPMNQVRPPGLRAERTGTSLYAAAMSGPVPPTYTQRL